MAWPYQVDGVDVFRLPPDDYVVDFDNPQRHKVLDHYLVFAIGAPLAFMALLQRFYTKQFLSKGLQVDDALMCVGWLASLLTQILLTTCISQEIFGVHSWEVPLKDYEKYSLLSYIAAPIYMLCNGFVKLSLLTFYLHLSPQHWFRTAVWASITVVALYTTIITFMMFFNCNPPSKAFNFAIKGGSCIDAAILYMATAVSNIITDVMLFLLPIPMLYKLHMPKIQKVGAIVVFGIGSATVATSIIRLLYLPGVLNSDDPSWDGAPANVWTFVEANLFVICGSMPTLRKFFKHFLPRLMGTSGHGGSSFTPYGNGGGGTSATLNPQHGTISRMRTKNRHYSQFASDANGSNDNISEEDVMEMERFSGEKKPTAIGAGATVTIGTVNPGDGDAQRDDHSERAILQTTSFTVEYT